jgi:hypothetical protein
MRYLTRVEESCLNVHGTSWLPPHVPGLIKHLVLDVSAPPESPSDISRLIGPGRRYQPRRPAAVDRLPVLDRAPLIRAGISMGPVSVEVREYEAEPRREPSGWEDVAEFSVLVRDKPAYIGGFNQDFRTTPDIGTAGPGWYRLRVHARGRATAPDLVVTEPTEDYLVQVWRADHAEPLALTESVTQP